MVKHVEAKLAIQYVSLVVGTENFIAGVLNLSSSCSGRSEFSSCNGRIAVRRFKCQHLEQQQRIEEQEMAEESVPM